MQVTLTRSSKKTNASCCHGGLRETIRARRCLIYIAGEIYLYTFLSLSLSLYIYRRLGGVSPAGPPVTGKSFRVVPCVRTCVRAVLGLVRFQANRRSCPFPFPFFPAGFSLFPYASTCFLFPRDQYFFLISMISMISTIPSESK